MIGELITRADAEALDGAAQDDWAYAACEGDRVRRIEITTDPVEAGLCASCERALDDDCDGPECACCAAEGLL